jgi:hypothetical protein
MRLTERQEAILRYVCEHRGCSLVEAGLDLNRHPERLRDAFSALFARRLIARQMGMINQVPTRYWAEEKGYEYIERRAAKVSA